MMPGMLIDAAMAVGGKPERILIEYIVLLRDKPYLGMDEYFHMHYKTRIELALDELDIGEFDGSVH